MSDSNSETSSQIIPLKARADFPIRAEFRTWRPLAFELQRRGSAARNWVVPGSSASSLHRRWPCFGVAEKARIGRDLFRSEDDQPAAKPATPLLRLRWTFRANRACVVITDAEPARLAPLTPPAPMGLRGVWLVAARCCAEPWLPFVGVTKCHSIGRYTEGDCQQCLRLRVDGISFIARRCGGTAQSISYVRSHCARCA
jgi:hypothetical protein